MDIMNSEGPSWTEVYLHEKDNNDSEQWRCISILWWSVKTYVFLNICGSIFLKHQFLMKEYGDVDNGSIWVQEYCERCFYEPSSKSIEK